MAGTNIIRSTFLCSTPHTVGASYKSRSERKDSLLVDGRSSMLTKNRIEWMFI